MSEKRFECVFKEHETKNSWSMIKDNQLDGPLYIKDVVGLLNEQQATIQSLKEENEQLRLLLKERQYEKDIAKCREENRVLRQTTKTQQIRIYCQDQEIQKLNEQLNKIPNTIKEVWIE